MEFLIEALWAFQLPLCNGTFVFVFLSDTVRVARKTQICHSLEWFSIPFVGDSFGFSALVLEICCCCCFKSWEFRFPFAFGILKFRVASL